MNHIEEIKNVKTFEELLILRDTLSEKVKITPSILDNKLYFKHEKDCVYRNMLDRRILYLEVKGFALDQIEVKEK